MRIKKVPTTPRPPMVFGGKQAEVLPMTGIHEDQEDGTWEVYYKGVLFAELDELKDAYERLQKLLALDSVK